MQFPMTLQSQSLETVPVDPMPNRSLVSRGVKWIIGPNTGCWALVMVPAAPCMDTEISGVSNYFCIGILAGPGSCSSIYYRIYLFQ